ncbi:MAG: hypothetical protein ACXW5J_24235 [Thermoanaerobaculia bacterium]
MAARVREEATYEDLLKVPENMVAELIEGELYASPRPAGPHTNAQDDRVRRKRLLAGPA